MTANVKLTQLKTAYDALRKDKKESKQEVIQLHKKLTSIELTNERLDHERVETHQHAQDTQNKLLRVESQLKRTSRENVELRRQLEDLGTQLRDSKAVIDRLSNELADSQKEVQFTKSELARKEKVVEESKTSILAQKNEHEKLLREYNSLMVELHANDREKVKVGGRGGKGGMKVWGCMRADLLQVVETTCIKLVINSLDNQLVSSLLTTCSRLVIIKPEQTMQTHSDIDLMTGLLVVRVNKVEQVIS